MSAIRQIIEAVIARVGALDGTGDIRCDVGGRIYRGREGFDGEHDAFPLASVNFGGWRNREDATIDVKSAEISVTVLSRAKLDEPLDTELELVEDLEAVLYPAARRIDGRDDLDGTALWLEVDGCVVLPRQDGGKLCEVRIDLVVNYQEPLPCA